MIPYLVLGATYAFAAAVQPGPLQTYLISQTLSNGWRRTLPAALTPVISDGPIIVLVLFILNGLPERFNPALRCAGGVFLLYLAAVAFKQWRGYTGTRAEDGSSMRRSMLRAALVNLLNPNPYLGWSLVLGPLLLEGWKKAPANGVALVIGFYATMIFSLAGIIALCAAAGKLGHSVGRCLVGLSAVALASFAGYQFLTGIKMLIIG
jgi:threonine/homoserine/homoserine lactone efflux protein